MDFVFNKWDSFCEKLDDLGINSIPASQVNNPETLYLVLKHDVETDVPKAYKMAKIEKKHNHKGSYYIQAYLMKDNDNLALLKEMQNMGHEISYHYDVMDSCKGDLEKALEEFKENKNIFEKNGFILKTVCQHGNPIVERKGYNSNRDFFRSKKIREEFSEISDIMVNYKDKYNTEYNYYSDAGRKFKLIFDPINNDINNSDDKNIAYNDLYAVLDSIQNNKKSVIISTHPHRWTSSAIFYRFKKGFFKIVKWVAKILIKIPLFKKIMGKYYYLAKKI